MPLHDMFATPDGTIKVAVQSNKHMAFALAKWISKKAVERYTNKQLKREMLHLHC